MAPTAQRSVLVNRVLRGIVPVAGDPAPSGRSSGDGVVVANDGTVVGRRGRRRRADVAAFVVVDVLVRDDRLAIASSDARTGRVEDEPGHGAEREGDGSLEESDVLHE